jgi:acyl-CoA hydrolase
VRALALISIANPDFREHLELQTYDHQMIPRGVSF